MNQYQNSKQSRNPNQTGKYGWGVILICAGVLLVLSNLGLVPSFGQIIGTFWPMILIFISLMFHIGYYSNRNNVGLLVPGGILLTVGIVCQISMLWNLWGFMWPGFTLAPAVGLFELYIFGKREKGLLIPVGILSGLSLIFFTSTFHTLGGFARYMIPAILIIIGGLVLVQNNKQQNENRNQDFYHNADNGQNQNPGANNQQNYNNTGSNQQNYDDWNDPI